MEVSWKNLPKEYEFLKSVGTLPRMVAIGINLLGIKEIPGKATNNPVIMSMAAELGIPHYVFPNDETAWCAVAHCWICKQAQKPYPNQSFYHMVRAGSFATWGVAAKPACLGDTLVFSRPQGNHVGTYICEDDTYYHVMGGNQKNAFSIIRIEKTRCTHIRRLYAIGAPASVKPYRILPGSSIPVSVNES